MPAGPVALERVQATRQSARQSAWAVRLATSEAWALPEKSRNPKGSISTELPPAGSTARRGLPWIESRPFLLHQPCLTAVKKCTVLADRAGSLACTTRLRGTPLSADPTRYCRAASGRGLRVPARTCKESGGTLDRKHSTVVCQSHSPIRLAFLGFSLRPIPLQETRIFH